jgi:hypothetical protein
VGADYTGTSVTRAHGEAAAGGDDGAHAGGTGAAGAAACIAGWHLQCGHSRKTTRFHFHGVSAERSLLPHARVVVPASKSKETSQFGEPLQVHGSAGCYSAARAPGPALEAEAGKKKTYQVRLM